ncbi:MAG: hypothetical protein CL489_17755 [Acidobacteria bacterium]|nr:hypothetical protein [Acidobacteriota bacterium]
MTQEEKVIDRINKLLALAESANQFEAELALEKASELMEQHAIEEAKLRTGEVETPIMKHERNFTHGGKPWERMLANCVALAFGCKLLTSKRSDQSYFRAWLYGTQEDIEIVITMIDYAVGTVDRFRVIKKADLKTWKSGVDVKSYMHSYVVGIAEGMMNTLQAIRDKNKGESEYGLILRYKNLKVKDFIDDTEKNVRTSSTSSSYSGVGYGHGFREGSKVGFNGKKATKQLV